ncbi:MAG: NADH-quinone oxidoreductase subunit, partial [Actinomycetota bacterium]|nr:NADH-quinone oxidoreductase subunit [Actinomycetota bacterium]
AGFWSKDEILANAGHNDYKLFLVIGLVGAFMTAAYMTRCVYLTFHGEYRGAHAPHAIPHVDEAEHDPIDTMASVEHDAEVHSPHESNRLITTPLWVLSFFAVFAGFLNFPHWSKFEKWFDPHFPPAFAEIPTIAHPAAFNPILATLSVLLAGSGIAIVWAYYEGRLPQALSTRYALLAAGKRVLVNKLYLDYLYENVIVAGIKGPIASGVYWVNQNIIDNVLNYAGKGTQVVGRFTYNYLDQKGVDGLVNGIGAIADDSGGEVRRLQTGRLQFYALMLVAAVVIFAGSLWIFT